MALEVMEPVVAKRASASTRLAADIVDMANVIASLQKRPAIEVLDDIVRGPIAKLYKSELSKANRAAEKKPED